MKAKIYIAGKVTGEPLADCTMKFGTAQIHIEDLGFEVVNPLNIVPGIKMPWEIAMRICIDKLITCQAIYLLEDWHESTGAQLERNIAIGLNMPQFMNIDELKKHYAATHHLHD